MVVYEVRLLREVHVLHVKEIYGLDKMRLLRL